MSSPMELPPLLPVPMLEFRFHRIAGIAINAERSGTIPIFVYVNQIDVRRLYLIIGVGVGPDKADYRVVNEQAAAEIEIFHFET